MAFKRRATRPVKISSSPSGRATDSAGAGSTRVLQRSGVLVVSIAVLVCALHWWYLSALHENDLYFSHLSTLERELSFRTEMGLYYSYYKTLVNAHTLSSGLASLTSDNMTEYPSTINTLARFNLAPEVVLGAMFRGVRSLVSLTSVNALECFTVARGRGQASIEACNGIGDPVYFYVQSVFAINGLLPAVLFLLAVTMSGSVVGGCTCLLMFLYNHTQATRVMWTPPLRESFGIPLIYIQLLALSRNIRCPSPLSAVLLMLSTVAALISWQFTPLALTTQVLCVCALWSLSLLTSTRLLVIVAALAVSLLVSCLLQFGNIALLSSFFAASLLAAMVMVCVRWSVTCHVTRPLIRAILELVLTVTLTLSIKLLLSKALNNADNAHIGTLLLSKLSAYKDFHTQLYLCSKEFDYLPLTFALYTSLTLLLPMALVVMATGLWTLLIRKEAMTVEPIDTVKVYHILQCLWFVVMAMLIMRLKVFLTPQLALLSSLVANKVRGQWVWLLLGCASISGVYNVYSEMRVMGEYNNPSQEQLVTWVNASTNQNAVFAGAMPTMATIRLVTGRPIVNHPHYENVGMRARTKLVYSVYSRQHPTLVLASLHSLEASHVIVEGVWCHKAYKDGCSFGEVWDFEDPSNRQRPLFCDLIGQKIEGFKTVFRNNDYTVLELA